jgi:hypothetical protein
VFVERASRSWILAAPTCLIVVHGSGADLGGRSDVEVGRVDKGLPSSVATEPWLLSNSFEFEAESLAVCFRSVSPSLSRS